MSETKHGYANFKRAELLKLLKPFLGRIKNISTGIEANLSKKSLDKMTSAKALEKSKNNGFTLDEHFEIDEINKASERFEGLSDAAANVANRATKTPHIDGLNLTQKNSDVNNMSHGLDFPNGKSGGNKRICSCLTTLTFKKRRPLGLSKSAC